MGGFLHFNSFFRQDQTSSTINGGWSFCQHRYLSVRSGGRSTPVAIVQFCRLLKHLASSCATVRLDLTGFIALTPDQLPPGMSKFEGIPHISGANGGHTINLHQFARDGIILLGHLRGAAGEQVGFAPDLYENLAKVDQFERDAVKMIDGYIQAKGLDAPAEELPHLREGYKQPVIETLDLKTAGIKTVIWAMGYTFDSSLVKLPVQDEDGFPIQSSGVTRYAGLYFVGLPWMPSERSGFLLGAGDSAQHIASHLAEAATHR